MNDRFALMSTMTLSATMALASAALAIGPEVIYTKIPTHPSSIVPGALDLNGQPAVTNFRALEQIYISPNGSRWMLIGRTQQGSDLETIMLIGSGTSGTMFLQEGQPVPDQPAGELIDFFGSAGGKFNESNEFAGSFRARNGSNTQFQKVFVYTGGLIPSPTDFNVIARGGNSPGVDLYSGLQDIPANPSGDETIGNSIGSIHILNDGRVGAQDNTINNISTTRRPAIFYTPSSFTDGTVTFGMFQQAGVTTFLDMDGITPRTYDSGAGGLGSNSFYTTPDGKRWIVNGEILGAATDSDAVLIVDGQARLQEGVLIPNSTAMIHTFVTTELIANGDWYARGLRRVAGVSNGVWAVRNGSLLAQTGDPVSSPLQGPIEHWASSFFAINGNSNGDWLLGGKTDNPDLAIDDVIVVNGEVVLREGDPIDLDANGQYDDNVFIGRGVNTNSAFEPDDATLTADGVLYLYVNLRDGQGNDLNSNPAFGAPQAFVRFDLTPPVPPCPGDIAPGTPDGQVNVQDMLAVINVWGPCEECPPACPGDLNEDCDVNVADLLTVLNAWGPCPK